jgi:riboflavin synthase
MFTGLIEEVGEIALVQPSSQGVALTIRASLLAPQTAPGDSLAINGICLTVEEQNAQTMRFYAGTETLARTTAGSWRPGLKVNLERALRADGRLGGHFVLGHVDCVGKLLSRRPEGETERLTFELPAPILGYLAPQGSIAVDGISLTVAALTDSGFSVAIIPYTMAQTNLPTLSPGAPVNLEIDLLVKYLERLLRRRDMPSGGLTEEFLAEHGFT